MEITTRSWTQAIALVDCDNFFVSCELLLNPKLKGKPVCVLSNNDGCVISRSKEAKRLNIKMGEPVFLARKRVPEAIYLSSNFHHYGIVSDKIMNILKSFTPEVEVYSIDEAFVDLTGVRQMFKKPYLEIIKDIREKVLKETGIPVSIGVSLSKVLAKIATKIAKDKSDGLFSISGKELRETLPKISIGSIWQIGHNTESLLLKHGIDNAYKLACQDEKWVEKTLTKKGLELQMEMKGYSIWKVDTKGQEIKGIQRTKSFASSTNDKEIIRGALFYHLHKALTELRRKNLKAGLLSIMLRRKDFQSFSLNTIIDPPSNFEFDFTNRINSLFNNLYKEGLYRSCGIHLTNFTSGETEQLNLFSQTLSLSNKKKESLAETWDSIEQRFGKQSLRTASMPSLNYLDKRAIRGIETFSSFEYLPEVR
jgi:DNA polymerase-4/DNA polymerase V